MCPNPLAPNSIRYCEKHLAKCRDKSTIKSAEA